MAVSIKNLGNGTITNGTAQNPGPAAGKSWLVKNIALTNRNSSSCAVDVKAVGKLIAPPSLVIAALTTLVLDHELTLQGATEALTIQVMAGSTSPGLDYVISGVERDLS